MFFCCCESGFFSENGYFFMTNVRSVEELKKKLPDAERALERTKKDLSEVERTEKRTSEEVRFSLLP